MNNKRIKELEGINDILANSLSYIILGENNYFIKLCETQNEKEVKDYIKILKKHILDTKEKLETYYGVTSEFKIDRK